MSEYRTRVRREILVNEGRKVEREENVDYLMRLAAGLRSEAEDSKVAEQIDADEVGVIQACAKVLEMAAENISTRKAAV